MSKVQAIILTGEPEDIAKTLREYMGQVPVVTVIQSPELAAMGQVNAAASSDPLVSFIKRVLTRNALAPRHLQLFKLLYNAGESGMMRVDLTNALGIEAEAIKGIVGPLGRRVAGTPGHDEMVAADGQRRASELLLDTKLSDNDWHFSLRPETRRALEELHIV